MHVPWPFTAFEGIYRVPPASVLEYHEGKLELIRTRSLPREAERHDRDPVATATNILRDTVARQMVADVPVGAFLSGGVDSTLIVALMRQVSNAPIHTQARREFYPAASGSPGWRARSRRSLSPTR